MYEHKVVKENKRSFGKCASILSILITALILTGTVMAVTPTLSNSGGGTWNYYKIITIYNPNSSLTDYQLLVQLNSSTFPINASISGEDIRFTDITGNELNYWIEDWNYISKSANIWVRLSTIPFNSSSITMWYGNPSAISQSNGSATFLQWHGAETLSFKDENILSATSGLVYEAKIRTISDASYVRWGIGNIPGNEVPESVHITSYAPGNFRILTTYHGTPTDSQVTPNLVAGIWYRAKFTVTSTEAHGYLDGVEFVPVITTNIPTALMGLQMIEKPDGGEQAFSFARNYAVVEPSYLIGLENVNKTSYAVVYGRIYEIGNSSAGISGAAVNIKCVGPENTVSSTSGDNGYYLSGISCPYGNMVEVSATTSTESGSNTGKINSTLTLSLPFSAPVDVGVAQIDVSVAIPEFPTAAIPAILSIASFGLVSFRIRKR